jgi:hypothetical protein
VLGGDDPFANHLTPLGFINFCQLTGNSIFAMEVSIIRGTLETLTVLFSRFFYKA